MIDRYNEVRREKKIPAFVGNENFVKVRRGTRLQYGFKCIAFF